MSVTETGDVLFAFDLFGMGDIGLVVVVLNAQRVSKIALNTVWKRCFELTP